MEWVSLQGWVSAQPHTTLCIQFLDRENNDKNNTLPLGKQICFTIVWGCAEILPKAEYNEMILSGKIFLSGNLQACGDVNFAFGMIAGCLDRLFDCFN